jgi:hypothetical protein
MVAKVVVPSYAYRVQYRAKYKEFLVADFLDLNTRDWKRRIGPGIFLVFMPGMVGRAAR